MRDPAHRAPEAPVDDAGLASRVEASAERMKGRYQIGDVLGKGGMAVVYRVVERATGRQLALKELVLPKTDKHYAESAALFEREYHTLAQLSHPHIIAVHDYGVDESGPFYTMELLDGGDLRGQSPVPWKTACALVYDACSALALIHSRRLIHRDLTPRNIRSTPDGTAKLIDFGAMVPMGPGGLIVGTPQFVAPEVVNRSSLDARTDLFSLGATFYYALTGRAPYAAKDFAQLFESWEVKPSPPSRIVPEIPPALDALVLSLLSIDPATRPRSAFEVMQRLAAIAGIERAESLGVSRAYLSTPVMVGRDGLMSALQHEMTRAFGGRGRGVVIQGRAGLGRSRLLDACALVAKTLGSTVLRASGSAARAEDFRVAGLLAQQLMEVAPEAGLRAARDERIVEAIFEAADPAAEPGARATPKVRDFGARAAERVALQSALGRWLMRVSQERPLTIAVDDVHRIDEASAALIAALSSQVERRHVLLAATADTEAEPADRLAFDVLVRNSTRLNLAPLSREETERLFTSVFGDVPNVGVLSDGIFAIAGGNPRESMDLAQHLVDRGLVRYDGGTWTIPPKLDATDLPATAADAIRARVARLSSLARWLAEAQCIATHRVFTREDYAQLRPDASPTEVDAAILDLVTHQIVASDGRVYTILHDGLTASLTSALSDADRAERHRALSELYEGRLGIGVVRHALLGGFEERALDKLGPALAETPEATTLYGVTDIGAHELAATFERALDAAERLGRSPREINELRRWLASVSIASDDKYYWRAAPGWLERLKQDSGYRAWEELADIAEPGPRLSRAMQLTYERYMATPEAERAYRPDEAIKGLVRYVAISIAIGSSRIEGAILESLPPLLEPFAPLSELVHVVWQNSLATRETSRIQPEKARERWIDVYDRLGRITGSDAQYADIIRHAVAFGLGSIESWMGMAAAATRADALDTDPLNQVNAFYLRRIVRMQQGDWDGAEKFRKQAEVLSLQARSRQMFTGLVSVELSACTMARDITGLKQCTDKVRALAAMAPGWIPYVRLAEGRFHLVCENYAEALERMDKALELVEPRADDPYPLHTAWCPSVAGRVEALVGLGRFEEAKATAEEALALAGRLDIHIPAHEIERSLALAEAKLGQYDVASERLESIIRAQKDHEITGLHLGASYEARARVAIWANDEESVEEYAVLTAREYRYGEGSPLGARYERLMAEARRTGPGVLPGLSDFESSRLTSAIFPRTSATMVVTQAMKGADGAQQRAARALDLLCHARAASSGHLYLFGEKGVRLVASYGPEPPSGLSDFVKEYVERELSESDVETGFVDENSSDESERANTFADDRGSVYHPLFLTASSNGATCYAGVAVLASSEDSKAMDVELLVALGTHLMQMGDARGIRL